MAFRNLLLNFRQIRNIRMSARLNAEKVLEELQEKNPYYEKYAAKIAKLQATSPEELMSRLELKQQKEQKETRWIPQNNSS